MNGWAEFLAKLVELLERLLPTLAAYFAGKKVQAGAEKEKTLEGARRAKAVANRVDEYDDSDVKRLLATKWTRKPVVPDNQPDLAKSE